MLEFTNGKTVQAIWQKRAERDDSGPTTDLPPLAPTWVAPPPAPVAAVGSTSASSIGVLFRRDGRVDDERIPAPDPDLDTTPVNEKEGDVRTDLPDDTQNDVRMS